MKVIIVGGVAGGASAAARLRRMDEAAEIILLERSEYVSYANCGLPYYIGGRITDRSALEVQTPEGLRRRLKLDVRIRQEAIRIEVGKKELEIRNLDNDTTYMETYDKLILSPGAEPIRPLLNGMSDQRVFTLRTIPDTDKIDAYIREHKPQQALIIGAGFIGLEMAENLTKAGLQVTIAEQAAHAIAALDEDMAVEVHDYLGQQGIKLMLQNGVSHIEPGEDKLHVTLEHGEVDTDMVLLSIGVRPESMLAKTAGLTQNKRGAIVVNNHLQTSNPDIYAVGDVIEITHKVTGQPGYIPLAGPANKQGRIAADHIAGIDRKYRGTQGSAILKIFDMTVGATGINETVAAGLNLDYDKVYLRTDSHARYYPGAAPISLKVLFERADGRILGAQAMGREGVDKRLDVLAVAIRHNMTAYDLSELELSYAPPFSSAKDPVNMVGFMIENLLEGRAYQFNWSDVAALQRDRAQLIDVRTPDEYARGNIAGAVNIPLDSLRQRSGELNRGCPVYLYCHSGQRSYLASRILAGAGYDVRHLAGGYYRYAKNRTNDHEASLFF